MDIGIYKTYTHCFFKGINDGKSLKSARRLGTI